MISSSDIKLLESEIMSDSPDGGGRKTSRVIVDGVMGNVFPKISRIDSVYGRVNLRKVYGGVVTANQDTYAGAHAIVTDAPDNPNVSCCLFSTGSEFDNRTSVQARIESYLNAGSEWPGYLFENHIKGQKVIQIISRIGSQVPTVGKTIILRCNEGTQSEYEQYVRVTRVSTVIRTFTITGTNTWEDYKAWVTTCDISDAMRYDFKGSPASRYFLRAANTTIIRDTVVADAAVYNGICPLSAPVVAGTNVVKAKSIFTQLVPNTKSETPALDLSPSSEYTLVLATSPRYVTDSGAPFSQRIRVGTENRGFSYVTMVKPLPTPGTVKVVYRSMGANHILLDDGAGGLTGEGAGTINYLTGSISITLQTLPDDRSNIVFYWGQTGSYTNRAGFLNFKPPEVVIPLEHPGLEAGTLTVTWTAGGVIRTATSNSVGDIVGDGVGRVDYAGGMVYLRPSYMPEPGAAYTVSYKKQDMISELKNLNMDATGSTSIVLSQVPLPGSIELTWLVSQITSASSGSSAHASTANRSSESHGELVGTKQIAQYAQVKINDYAELANAVMAQG